MRLKLFLSAMFLSLPLWLGINLLEKNLKDFFFANEIRSKADIFAAQILLEQKKNDYIPVKKGIIEDLNVNSNSASALFVGNDGKEKVLFDKGSDRELPIASLSKIMTALIVLENYDLGKEIVVSEESVQQEEEFGKLEAGAVFKAKYLLYPLLIESSNDAAYSLANDYEDMDEEKFVRLMNKRAEDLGMSDTIFNNTTGLDGEEGALNYSSSNDLILLIKESLRHSLIWQILKTRNFDVYGPELVNTNKMLSEEQPWQDRIIGGKTGYTDEAGGCMILVMSAPKNKGKIIYVILGSNNQETRFEEMKKLVEWTNEAYNW